MLGGGYASGCVLNVTDKSIGWRSFDPRRASGVYGGTSGDALVEGKLNGPAQRIYGRTAPISERG
jgi:hypothetical protein